MVFTSEVVNSFDCIEQQLMKYCKYGEMANYLSELDTPWRVNNYYFELLTIESGVTSIGNYAFSYCKSFINITIPDNVTSIRSCAFSGCEKFTSVNIGDNLNSINWFYFCMDTGIIYININYGVTPIGNYTYAF